MNGTVADSITGYNRSQVIAMLPKIQAVYKAVATGVGNKIQEDFVIPMSVRWYAPEAVEEFNLLKENIAKMGDAFQWAYDNFKNWMQNAGTEWAEKTGGEAPDLGGSLATIPVEIDTSVIKDNANGNITLDVHGARYVCEKIDDLYKSCMEVVKEEHEKLDQASAFMGQGQGKAVHDCFREVGIAIDSFFKILKQIQDRMGQYADKYEKVGQEIARQLSSARLSTN